MPHNSKWPVNNDRLKIHNGWPRICPITQTTLNWCFSRNFVVINWRKSSQLEIKWSYKQCSLVAQWSGVLCISKAASRPPWQEGQDFPSIPSPSPTWSAAELVMGDHVWQISVSARILLCLQGELSVNRGTPEGEQERGQRDNVPELF